MGFQLGLSSLKHQNPVVMKMKNNIKSVKSFQGLILSLNNYLEKDNGMLKLQIIIVLELVNKNRLKQKAHLRS